jgi:hypothetical protein
LKKLIFVILVAISVSGCLPSLKISESEYKIVKLTQVKAESRDRDFYVLVPQNWFSTKDVNYNGNEIWLVRENYSAVIVIKKINLLSTVTAKDKNEKLLSVAKLSATLHKRKNENSFQINQPPKLFQNGNLIYSSYEYGFGENQIARVVLTQIDDEYFECIAYTTSKGTGRISLIELYSIQESVVASLGKS